MQTLISIANVKSFRRAPGRGSLVLLVLALCLTMGLTSMVLAGATIPVADTERLVGRWVRPDGGYLLEFSTFTADGNLTATYNNQRPVHVAQAKWRANAAGVDLFIELRDVNYPGSTYRLHYAPASDRLQGIYFQAMYQQSYPVEFIRSR